MNEELPGLTTAQAAQRLNAALGAGVAYWTNRIRNQMKSARTPSERIPTKKVGGRWAYSPEALDEWIGAESARRLARGELPITRAGEVFAAFGIGQDGGSRTGRTLKWHTTAQLDDSTGELFLQFTIQQPFMVFRLNPEEAARLARDLADAAAFFARNTK